MLRYILLKLPSFTSKTDFPVSPPCTKASIFRSASPIKTNCRRDPKKTEESRSVHKRSYSFPSTRPKSYRLFENEPEYENLDKTDIPKTQDQDTNQRKGIHQFSRKGTKKILKRLPADKYKNYSRTENKSLPSEVATKNMYELDNSKQFNPTYEEVERYELEAARPRRSQSELTFNVIDYVTRNANDPVRYLQPNKLKPFGSDDNIYLPLSITTKKADLVRYPQSTSVHSLQEPAISRSIETEPREVQRRGYSTTRKENDANKCVPGESKSCNEIDRNHKELSPSFVATKFLPKLEDPPGIPVGELRDFTRRCRKNSASHQNIISDSKSSEEPSGKTAKEINDDIFQSYRSSWNEPRIRIEPSPFLKGDGMYHNLGYIDFSKESKKLPSDNIRLEAPWPSYSERVKRNEHRIAAPAFESSEKVPKEKLQSKTLLPQKRTISTENIKLVEKKSESKQLHKQSDKATNNILQRRSLSTEFITSRSSHYQSGQNIARNCKSSTYTDASSTKDIPSNLISNIRTPNTFTRKNYAKSSNSSHRSRPFEPESCEKKEEPTKYFLPSKVRLKPPKCLQKPVYRGCIPEDKCPPRADQCLKVPPKKLPILKPILCPCVEPYVPSMDPKMRRLKFKLEDPPRSPCDPCPCPPRADDFMKQKDKKLLPYAPGYCACVEPPPMVDVPLVRPKKLCEPEIKCYPPKPCKKEERCERADENKNQCPKSLPIMKITKCPCVEPYIPNVNPQLRRLKMELKDTPRICPCEPNCPCPPRSDDFLQEKLKKLPVYKPGHCECVEPPPMIDVPLKKLTKVCPPEVCDPHKECPVETCEDRFRADDLLKEQSKQLPILKIYKCKCVEPEIPDKLPKLHRLKMKLTDEPKICPCDPNCPCPPRADDNLTDKPRKLLPYVPGYCKCVEPPPMLDVPLTPLKKICEPEQKCYPKKPCPREIPCEEKPRADDKLCTRPKKLRVLEATKCPCIENPTPTDVPQLKRLNLFVAETLPMCPDPEPCVRSDDSLKDKIRKLPLIKIGSCPCVDPKPVEDVKPLVRLKCKDEEPEQVCEDPCVPYPRADWGCWEYSQSVDPDSEKSSEKCKNTTKGKPNYNAKRKFNTDSTVTLQNRIKTELRDAERKLNSENSPRTVQRQTLKNETVTNKYEVDNAMHLQGDYVRNLNGKVNVKKRKSLPTLHLLRKLNEMERKWTASRPLIHSEIIDLKPILSRITTRARLQESFLNTTTRKLCTGVVRQPENTTRPVSTGQIIFSSKKDNSCKNKKKDDSKKPRVCRKVTDKCPTMILKGCAQKSPQGCSKERTPICCEKKSTPYPSFSETMDEEIEPYSNASQWSCNRKHYGFEHHPKKFDEPLDTVKDKKKFSTSTSSCQYSQQGNAPKRSQEFANQRPKTCGEFRELSTRNISNGPIGNSSWSKVNTGQLAVEGKYSQLLREKGDQSASGRNYGSTPRGDDIKRRPKSCGEVRYLHTRNTRSIPDTMTNASRPKVNIACIPVREKCSRLLHQKAPGITGMAGLNCGNISRRGYSTLQPNNPNVLNPVTTEIIPQNLYILNNLSSATTNPSNTTNKPEFPGQFHRSESNFRGKGKNNKKSACKKKACPKFKLKNCPKKGREDCKVYSPVICEKAKAPYPAFSDCMDEEMEEKISECPLEREKIKRLQPCLMDSVTDEKILKPVRPYQGKINPRLEEDCIRKKLCMENEGLTQSCCNFGEFVKPMRSKDYIKEKNKDCQKIEELKKLGKWPPKNTKGFCTSTNCYFSIQKRAYCALPKTFDTQIPPPNPENLKQVITEQLPNSKEISYSDQALVNRDKDYDNNVLSKSRRMCVRNYHALCKNSERSLAESVDQKMKVSKNQYADAEEPCRYMKLRNVQWRINNFQKWHRLNKLSNLPTQVKRYHTSSKTKFKRYIQNNQSSKHFCTSTAKYVSSNENSDFYAQRGISTTMMLARARNENSDRKPKFSLDPKCSTKVIKKCPKFKLPNCPPRARMSCERKRAPQTCTKMVTPNPAYSECYDEEVLHKISECPEERNRIQSLQPQYPLLPEIGSVSLPPTPHQGRIDRSLQNDYIRLKLGIPNEGLTQDCETFGQPVFKYKNLTNKYRKKNEEYTCPGLKEEVGVESDDENPCRTSKQSCPQPKCEDTLWQRIVNYFKARPNCPAPDDWKKRALREKAEKAAKAAGLCLCDPKDLPKGCCEGDLPKVVTPKCCCSAVNDDDNESCDDREYYSRKPENKSGFHCGRKRYSTKPGCTARRRISTVPMRNYSRNISWKSLEEINKSIEEEEKKRLEKKLPKQFTNDVNCLSEFNYDDDDDEHGPGASYEDILSEAMLNKDDMNDITKYVEVADKDSSINYIFDILPKDQNLVEIIFDEPVDELTNYSQAKAFAAFKDYLKSIEAFSEITYEDIEKAKTKKLLKELDKLLNDKEPSKEN